MGPKKVDYVCLSRQFSQLRDEIIGELNKVFDSGMFILGPFVERFEKEFADYIGAKNCIGVNSGTAALRLTLWALGVGKGDQVIVPSNSFLATAGAVVEVGAKPVFADVAEDLNIAPSEIERLAGKKTKAVIVVHLTGRPARMKEIMAIARGEKLFVIEDCAQAVGASVGGRMVGTLGDAGCFSFHPLKTLNAAGDGGAVVTESDEIAEKIRLLRNHGLADRDHCRLWGTNSRLDAIQAAILSVNLRHLEGWTEKRIANAQRYSQKLAGVVNVPVTEQGTRSVYHTYVIQAEKRDGLKRYLKEAGVDSKIHYPIPIHLQIAAGKQKKLPVCENLAKRILSLPVHQYLSEDDIDYVAEAIIRFYNS